MTIDLLSLVDAGGCSAKLPAAKLHEALSGLPRIVHERLLVDIDTHDDAGVYKLTDDLALIQTTDFFSPICSDPYTFGQIAAANALSDVYAMGGEAITALNLVLFPDDLDLEILREILAGGQSKVTEAGALIVGGHTIKDSTPKYGLAVSGLVHPDKIITNAGACPGEKLILTKPLGVGVIVAAKKKGRADDRAYQQAVENMCLLNKGSAQVMQEFGIKAATDITGFGLGGHALKLARASGVSLKLQLGQFPHIKNAYTLFSQEFIPCVVRRNYEYVEETCDIKDGIDPGLANLVFDAQTSGGILMSVPEQNVDKVLKRLKEKGYVQSAVIGEVLKPQDKSIYLL